MESHYDRRVQRNPASLVERGENSGSSYLDTNDRVQCSHCGVIIENWREGDDVDAEHFRLSPKCTSIRTKVGETVHNPVKREYNPVNTKTGYVYTAPAEPICTQADCKSRLVEVSASVQHAHKKRFPVLPRDIRARLDTQSSRKLLVMGFVKTLLAQVIGERLAETGDDFLSFMEYFLAVESAEQMQSGGEVDTMKSHYDRSVLRLSNPASLVERGETEPEPEPERGPASSVSTSEPSCRIQSSKSRSHSDSSVKRPLEFSRQTHRVAFQRSVSC